MRAMKDSGIAWIGEIPEEWKICRLKDLAHICNGCDCSQVLDENGKYPIIGSGGQFAKACKPLYCKESVLLGRKGTIDKPLYINQPFWTVDTMYYTEIKEDVIAKFFYYLCTQIIFDYYQYGTALPSMTQRDLYNVYFPFPMLEEQHRIADYLDRKCSQIDAIIARQQEVIEKLKAYKLSAITEAVTKGLNPHAPMKDSGVEWIGEIPEQWKVAKLKFVASFYNGDRSSKYPSGTDIVDEGVIFVTSNNLGNTFLDTTISTKYITKEKYDDLGGAKIRINDIIFCLRGSVGKCSINKSENEGTIASSLVVIRAKKILADYLIFALQCPGITAVSTLNAIGIGSLNLSADDISEIFIPIPPEKEAAEIAEFLYKRIGKIDHVINEKNNYVNHFVMYKKSLIYEVVTGKKEV